MENLSLLKCLLLLLLSFQPLQDAPKQMLKSCISFNPINQGSDNYTAADPDSDADGICDAFDVCSSGDDLQDADGDFIPDACDAYPACARFYDLRRSYLSGDSLHYHATHHIRSADSVAAGASAEYRAGTFIELLPGFIATQGSYALATIEPCEAAAKTTSSTKLNDTKSDKTLSVYPNPSIGIYTFELPPTKNTTIWQLSIKNIQGNIVYQASINGTRYICNIAHLPAGMYVYECANGTDWWSGKIVLMK
jgi:hypothetical protein